MTAEAWEDDVSTASRRKDGDGVNEYDCQTVRWEWRRGLRLLSEVELHSRKHHVLFLPALYAGATSERERLQADHHVPSQAQDLPPQSGAR